jgi:hypothetical protein
MRRLTTQSGFKPPAPDRSFRQQYSHQVYTHGHPPMKVLIAPAFFLSLP